jgi:dihydrofolate reductase
MRKLFLFMLVSVDGYFEGPNHDISWHNVDAEFNAFAAEQLGEIGMLVFGHTTYDLMASYWPTAKGIADDGTIAKLMNDMPKIAVSHQPFKADWSNTTVISENVGEAIKALKNQPGKDMAIFGSNNLCVSLMEEGLVDEFRIMVNPVALGKGNSLFTGLSKKVSLSLVRTRAFGSGNIAHYYTILLI